MEKSAFSIKRSAYSIKKAVFSIMKRAISIKKAVFPPIVSRLICMNTIEIEPAKVFAIIFTRVILLRSLITYKIRDAP